MAKYPGVREIKKGACYQIDFQIKGDRKWVTIKAKSPKEASIIRANEMAKYKPNTGTQAFSFGELKQQLELKCQADGNSKKTIYGNILPKFKNFFEVFLPQYYPHITNINQLTSPTIIEKYKVFRNRPNGWRDELTKLRTIVSKFVKIGLCKKEIYDNVLCGVKKPKRKAKLYKEISKSDMRKYLDWLKKSRPDYWGIMYFNMRLGWRRGQALSIKKKNIQFNDLRPVAITCEPQDTKNKEPFILRDIDEELAKVIKRYYFNRRKTEWLFPNRNSSKHHANHYTEYIGKTTQRVLGIRLTPHDFRHSFCTMRLNEGSTPRDIMAVTGHKDINSFNIYTHPSSDGTKKVIERSKLF